MRITQLRSELSQLVVLGGLGLIVPERRALPIGAGRDRVAVVLLPPTIRILVEPHEPAAVGNVLRSQATCQKQTSPWKSQATA